MLFRRSNQGIVLSPRACVIIISRWRMRNKAEFLTLVFAMDVSKRTRYRDFVWAIQLNRFGLQLVGLWPKMDEIVKNDYMSDLRVVIIFVLGFFGCGIPLICSLVRVRHDMILVIDNLQITLSLMVVLWELVMMRWKRSDKSPQFEFTLVIQAMTLFFTSITYTSVDAFLGLVVLHICGQLENFRCRLINLVSCKDFNSALRNYVIAHLRLIRFADKIEETFAFLMLGLVFYFGTVFCLYGFLLLAVISDSKTNDIPFSRVLYVMVGVTTLLVHTFLYCGAGELVTEQCEAICRAIHDLKWYKLESRKAKSLILLMTRASEPFRITAGKIVPLTMTTFCSLLKSSAGYISFLLAKRG
ncbi:PREDICTED: odorant receptor 43a-like isoform X2 [Vollenhovia emeryi]|uniref:odorant receptor 43a-like isoform X2 n=1 Tax=Vollenhovia emeryi TaxID=411798 RepID=UPI0005F501EC|nr:PREDICTED: odorant receptor 43a-like isoform X2 [Vollenhovia emeryi]